MDGKKKTVLVVGGGFAGLTVCQELGSIFNVQLVDPKTYFEYVPNSPHSLIAPETASRLLVEYPASTKHKQGLLVGLTSDGTHGTATLQGGEQVAFDYAVLCTGSSYPSGVKPSDTKLHDKASRLREFEAIKAKLDAAKTVVVVGGGSVGVEVASEVAETYPDAKVTLVCGGGVLERMDPKAGEYALAWLKKHKVEVLQGERISDWGEVTDGLPAAGTLTTSAGTTLHGDVVFKCLGVKPATTLYAASLSSQQLALNGAVAVEPTMQVKGWANVFAIGDCNNVAEEKTANMAGIAGMVAARNLTKLDQGKQLQTFPEDVFGGHSKLPMAGGFSLGAKEGVFQMGSDVQMGAAPAKMHSVIAWLYLRVVAGSRFWGWLFGSVLKPQVIKALTKEASKAAALAAAAKGTAGVGAVAPAAA